MLFGKKREKERQRERTDRKKPNGPVNNPPAREGLFKERWMCDSLIKISYAARKRPPLLTDGENGQIKTIKRRENLLSNQVTSSIGKHS